MVLFKLLIFLAVFNSFNWFFCQVPQRSVNRGCENDYFTHLYDYSYVENSSSSGIKTPHYMSFHQLVSPQLDSISNVVACKSYTLPTLEFGNYFTGRNGTGKILLAGTTITSSQTIYVYAQTGTIPNCASEHSFKVTINTIPTIMFSSNLTNGCVPLEVTFYNNSSTNAQEIVWDFGDGKSDNSMTFSDSVTHIFTSPGCFDVSLSMYQQQCWSSETKDNLICVFENAVADFSGDKDSSFLTNPTFIFVNNSSNSSIYKWSTSDGGESSENDFIYTFPDEPGVYLIELIADNRNGCPDTLLKQIEILEDFIFYLPNAFTPDCCGENCCFKPIFYEGHHPSEFTMYILNRSGEVIFETDNYSKGWGGYYGVSEKKCKDDIYIWRIVFKNNSTNKIIEKIGQLNLIN